MSALLIIPQIPEMAHGFLTKYLDSRHRDQPLRTTLQQIAERYGYPGSAFGNACSVWAFEESHVINALAGDGSFQTSEINRRDNYDFRRCVKAAALSYLVLDLLEGVKKPAAQVPLENAGFLSEGSICQQTNVFLMSILAILRRPHLRGERPLKNYQ